MVSTWEDFYAKHPQPQDLAHSELLLKAFIEHQLKRNNKVVLVTVSLYVYIVIRRLKLLPANFISL